MLVLANTSLSGIRMRSPASNSCQFSEQWIFSNLCYFAIFTCLPLSVLPASRFSGDHSYIKMWTLCQALLVHWALVFEFTSQSLSWVGFYPNPAGQSIFCPSSGSMLAFSFCLFLTHYTVFVHGSFFLLLLCSLVLDCCLVPTCLVFHHKYRKA